jgi:pyruvate/2-oxoglutarate dehydrogenase complex dihydrolipoamide acyltransferase (E2) component
MECLLEPSMVVSVGSPVDGVLDQVAVNRGDPVRKGQVVARLQSGVETAAVTLSRARVDFGRRKMERSETLAQKQLISTQEKDERDGRPGRGCTLGARGWPTCCWAHRADRGRASHGGETGA